MSEYVLVKTNQSGLLIPKALSRRVAGLDVKSKRYPGLRGLPDIDQFFAGEDENRGVDHGMGIDEITCDESTSFVSSSQISWSTTILRDKDHDEVPEDQQ